MNAFWKDKVVWLVGASDGIGAALAQLLSQEACELIISARSEDKLQALKADKSNVRCIALDLSDSDSYWLASEQVNKAYGKVDILINCAGIAHKSRVAETSEKVDRQIMEVNFMGIVQLTKLVLPNMIARNAGQIVTISSILGEIGLPFVATYAASKHALNGYFNSLRYEVEAHDIDITIISPGFIKTDITKKSLKGDGSTYNENSDAQSKGMDAGKCAAGIKRSIEKKKQFAYVGGVETNMPKAARWLPGIFQTLMKKMHKI